DRHCGGRGVDAAARFRHRDALYAMDPTLELQPAVGAPAADLEDDLLEAMHAVLAGAHHFHTPAASLGVARVHPIQVGGEDRSLVATRARSDLDNHVLVVVRILGDQGGLESLLELP